MANETHTEAVGEGLADALGVDAQAATDATPGMPQLDFSTFANQIFWLVVALIAIYLILTRVALPRIDGIPIARCDRYRNTGARPSRSAGRSAGLRSPRRTLP